MKTLFIAWQDGNSGTWFPIGRLTFDGREYKFAYTHGLREAQNRCGFQPLLCFPNPQEVYTSPKLFPLFSNRVRSRSRPDYPDFAQWLNMSTEEYDPIALLSRSGGQRVTDKFEVFPLPETDANGHYHMHFFARGLGQLPDYLIERINRLQEGEQLYMLQDLQNIYSRHALVLRTEDKFLVGYCPPYLLDDDSLEIIQQQPELVKIHVDRVNSKQTPLQFRLLCHMTAQWPQYFRPFSSQIYRPICPERAVIMA
ncbi:MAG: DNA-binding protein [Hormoscilla sp.]